MSIEKLFESLDEKVFTPELKESLKSQFNEAVELKALSIAREKIDEEIERLSDVSDDHIAYINEKAEEYVNLKTEKIVEAFDKYLDRAVEEFIQEAKDSLDESIKNEKADAMLEGFDAMLLTGGIEISKIVEAKKTDSIEAKLEESISKYDALVDEVIQLKEENEKLIQLGVIIEMKEGLSILESKEFERLANLVNFSKDSKYAEKLQTIKEAVKGNTSSVSNEDSLNEDKDKAAPRWSHLI